MTVREKVLVTEGMEQFLDSLGDSNVSCHVLWERFCEDTICFQSHLAEMQFREEDEDDLETMVLARKFGYSSNLEDVKSYNAKIGLPMVEEKVEVPKFIMEMIEYYTRNHSINDLREEELNNYLMGMFYTAAYTMSDVSLNYVDILSKEQRDYIRNNINDISLGLEVGYKQLYQDRYVLTQNFEGKDRYLVNHSLLQGVSFSYDEKDSFKFKSKDKAMRVNVFIGNQWIVKKVKEEM